MLSKEDRGIAVILFVLVSSIYFATITGITSSNDGSHYALVRALADNGRFEISPFLSFTEFQDYALNGDLKYSDRPPGTALLSVPIYLLGKLMPGPFVAVPSKHDPGNADLIWAVALCSLTGAGTITLFYLSLRRFFAIDQLAAVLAALALAFGTTNWKYSSVLFSHAPASLLIWLVIYLTLKADAAGYLSWPEWALLGFSLGFMPLVEYTNIIFTALAGLYLAGIMQKRIRKRLTMTEYKDRQSLSIAVFVLAGLLPLLFLFVYNTMNFGGPFEFSAMHADLERWPWNESIRTQFATPILEGFTGLLFYMPNPKFNWYNQGIFLLMPVTLLAFAGFYRFYRRSAWYLWPLMTAFVVFLLLFSKSVTYNPATNDGRYLTTFIGLWFVPVAFGIEWALDDSNRPDLLQAGILLFTFGAFFLSVQNQFMHIAFSWNHDLSPAMLAPYAALPDNIRLLFAAVFRNIRNVPLLWLPEALVLGLILISRRIRAARETEPA